MNFRNMIADVNEAGFSSTPLDRDLVESLGEPLYRRMNAHNLHPQRATYFNELAFHWPEDWIDVENGLRSFHDAASLKHIFSVDDATRTLRDVVGSQTTQTLIGFAAQVRSLVTRNHFGLPDNDLRLARVMARQMSESDSSVQRASRWHEDIGYTDRPYQQLLSVVVTTWGHPTEAVRYQPKVGELLIFNAFDRRRLLGLSDDLAFIHRGPAKGPKMFFFFEFLGRRAS